MEWNKFYVVMLVIGCMLASLLGLLMGEALERQMVDSPEPYEGGEVFWTEVTYQGTFVVSGDKPAATVNNIPPEMVNFTLQNGYLGANIKDRNGYMDITFISLKTGGSYINRTYNLPWDAVDPDWYFQWENETIRNDRLITMSVWDGAYFTNWTFGFEVVS